MSAAFVKDNGPQNPAGNGDDDRKGDGDYGGKKLPFSKSDYDSSPSDNSTVNKELEEGLAASTPPPSSNAVDSSNAGATDRSEISNEDTDPTTSPNDTEETNQTDTMPSSRCNSYGAANTDLEGGLTAASPPPPSSNSSSAVSMTAFSPDNDPPLGNNHVQNVTTSSHHPIRANDGPNDTFTLENGPGGAVNFHLSAVERQTMALATRESIRNHAGAYYVVPGISITRRERTENKHSGENNHGTGSDAAVSTDSCPEEDDEHQEYNLANLPANIDIIAEATLVEDDSDNDRGQAQDDAEIGTGSSALQRQHTAVATQETEHQGQQSASSGNESSVYDATLVKGGPLALLGTKNGKLAAGVSVILTVVLSISLVVGLSNRGSTASTPDQETSAPWWITPDQKYIVLSDARTAGNFCGATPFPQIFYDQYSSLCTKEQLRQGGTLQQAVAIAMHRPHSDCGRWANEYIYLLPDSIQDPSELSSCEISRVYPHMSLINGGAVQGEIAINTTINNETFQDYVHFTQNTTIAVMQLLGEDIIKVLNNALDFVTQEEPLNIQHSGAYPYASGLRYDVDLSSANGTKVSNVQVYDTLLNEGLGWIPIIPTYSKKPYWVVTTNWIASGGDGYLNGVQPVYVGITDLNHSDELFKYLVQEHGLFMRNPNPTEGYYSYPTEEYLQNMEGGYWSPPTLEEMSTTSFSE